MWPDLKGHRPEARPQKLLPCPTLAGTTRMPDSHGCPGTEGPALSCQWGAAPAPWTAAWQVLRGDGVAHNPAIPGPGSLGGERGATPWTPLHSQDTVHTADRPVAGQWINRTRPAARQRGYSDDSGQSRHHWPHFTTTHAEWGRVAAGTKRTGLSGWWLGLPSGVVKCSPSSDGATGQSEIPGWHLPGLPPVALTCTSTEINLPQ